MITHSKSDALEPLRSGSDVEDATVAESVAIFLLCESVLLNDAQQTDADGVVVMLQVIPRCKNLAESPRKKICSSYWWWSRQNDMAG